MSIYYEEVLGLNSSETGTLPACLSASCECNAHGGGREHVFPGTRVIEGSGIPGGHLELNSRFS